MDNKGISNLLRKTIIQRDNYECKKCGEQDKTGKILEVHHINPFYKSKDNSSENLITLCLTCHRYAPNTKEEFEEYISDQISAIFTIMVRAFNKVRQGYTDEEWEKLNQKPEKEIKELETFNQR